METQLRNNTVLQYFPRFKRFPIEIRCMIWGCAVHLCHSQFIQVSISDPQLLEVDAYPSNATWKHLFFSTHPNVPSLLHACRESRQAAKVFYTKGWETKSDGWSCDGWAQFPEQRADPTDCEIGDEFEDVGKGLYWRPDRDVVVFKHDKEPYACQKTSICKAEGAAYGLYPDERVRFVLMPQEIFERSLHFGNLQVPNVEILFVLVEKPREDPVLAGFGISERYTDDKFRGWMEREQEEWSEADFVGRLFNSFERKSTLGKIVVRIVTNLDEVSQIVADWPSPAELAQP